MGDIKKDKLQKKTAPTALSPAQNYGACQLHKFHRIFYDAAKKRANDHGLFL